MGTDSESLCGWRGVLWPCAVHGRPAGRRRKQGILSLLFYGCSASVQTFYEALEHTHYTSTYLPNLSNTPLGVAQVVGSVWRPVGAAQAEIPKKKKKNYKKNWGLSIHKQKNKKNLPTPIPIYSDSALQKMSHKNRRSIRALNFGVFPAIARECIHGGRSACAKVVFSFFFLFF